MIDIGLHLTSPQFAGEQADLVARARTAGVEALILTGTDLAGSRESATLAAEWPGYCFSTAGVHPHDAKSVDEQTLPALRALRLGSHSAVPARLGLPALHLSSFSCLRSAERGRSDIHRVC